MTIAIATIGLLVFALGVVGLVQPASLLGLVERPWRSRAGLYGAIAFRAAFGILLVTAASGTHFPRTLGALGLLSLVSAALIPLLGFDRMRRFIDWWLARPPGGVRIWSCVACAFGGFLVYAVV